MKRILLLALCALMLLLAGCTAVNQSNSFVDQPLPEVTATPQATAVPDVTQPPMVQLEVKPTWPPDATGVPTPAPVTPTPTPDNSTDDSGGFNGKITDGRNIA